MRTHTLHQQKPLFRRKDTRLPIDEARRDILQALQAALDHCGSGSLLSAQITKAITKAKNL
jgi:hypothetical protein